MTETVEAEQTEAASSSPAVELLIATAQQVHGDAAERRPSQEALARDIEEAIRSGTHLAVEAPVGSGKSFAYLVPAMISAATQRRRTLISTAGLSLQRQLIEEDAPAVAAAVARQYGREPRVAVHKGFGNYACRRKAFRTAAEMVSKESEVWSSYGEVAERIGRREDADSQLLHWAMTSEVSPENPGDHVSVPEAFRPTEERFRDRVAISSDECQKDSCPVREICFPHKARDVVKSADVAITNHALLGIQASQGVPVASGGDHIGSFDQIVVDEAHALPESVRSQSKIALDARKMESLANLALKCAATEDQVDHQKVFDAQNLMIEAFGQLIEYAKDQLKKSSEEWRVFDRSEQTFSALVRDVDLYRIRLGSLIPSPKKNEIGVIEDPLSPLARFERAVVVMATRLAQLVSEDSNIVTWFAWGDINGNSVPQFFSSLITVDDELYSGLWTRTDAVIAVSGTLSRSFAQEAGMTAESAEPYPLPFAQAYRQAARYVPKPSGPERMRLTKGPDDVIGRSLDHDDKFPLWAADQILALVQANHGSAMVLSASGDRAKRYAQRLREGLAGTDIEVLSQWDAAGKEVSKTLFKESQNPTVLVGTRSFFTGVDVKGPANSLVIIDTIPRDPNDVVSDARTQKVGYEAVYIEEPAVLLTQGLGRLIRAHDDTGMVVLLDVRMANDGIGFTGGSRYQSVLDLYGTPSTQFNELQAACDWLRSEAASR